MSFGFNSKAQIGDAVYDVQTEDRGVSHPFIDTLVLIKGRVVYRHRASYEDLAMSGAADQAILRARVEKQHREILEALREGALTLEKAAPAPAGGIVVRLLNAASWLKAGQVSLDISVSSKVGEKPVTEAQVEAFIEDGAGAPEIHLAHTDAAGRTSFQFAFPTLAEPASAALVIRARAAEVREELRYQLKPKKADR